MRTLATDEIGKSYRGRRVVNGVSLRVDQGEVVGLLGPNGAGKTTTFYAIVGLIPPDTGRVLYDGQDITDVPMYLRARQYGISYLPQEASVFRKLTVEEKRPRGSGGSTMSWHERREKMENLSMSLDSSTSDRTADTPCRVGNVDAWKLRAACASTYIHFAGRTVLWNRSHRRAGFAEDNQQPARQRHRSTDYGSQRARNAYRD